MAGTSVAGAVVRGGGGLFSKLFRFKFAYILVIILFIQAIAVGINSGNGTIGIVQALGEKFLNVTQNIQVTSLQIIENGAKFTSWWSFISVLWSLISNVWLVYLWIKLFIWLFGKSPLSNESEGFKNIIFSLITFLLLQIFYLFLFSNPLSGQNKFDMIKTPIYAFWDLIKAVILIFSSLGFKKAVESGLIQVVVSYD